MTTYDIRIVGALANYLQECLNDVDRLERRVHCDLCSVSNWHVVRALTMLVDAWQASTADDTAAIRSRGEMREIERKMAGGRI